MSNNIWIINFGQTMSHPILKLLYIMCWKLKSHLGLRLQINIFYVCQSESIDELNKL